MRHQLWCRASLSGSPAKSAHQIDDEADHQDQAKPAAANGRAAKVKPTATEQEQQHYDE